MRKKHICIFTNTFYPEIGAASGRIYDLTKELVKNDFDVEVFTGMPFYPTQNVQKAYRGKFFKKEIIEGVTVNRFWVYPSHSGNPLKRLFTMMSLVGSMVLSGKLFVVGKTDFVWVQYPPVTLPILAYAFSFFKKAKFILNVSDLWPKSIADLGYLKTSSIGFRILKSIEVFLYKKSDFIVTQSQSLQAYIEVYNKEVSLIRTGVKVERFEQKLDFSEEKPIRMIYCGTIGLAHGLSELVEQVFVKDCFTAFELHLYGDGAGKKAILEILQRYPILKHKIVFKAMVSAQEVPALMQGYDLALVSQKTDLQGTVPAKLYEAMAIGIPVLGILGKEARQMVEDAGAGWTVPPQAWDELSLKLLEISQLPKVVFHEKGNAGRQAAEQRYDRDVLNKTFIEVLKRGVRSEM